MKGPRKWIGFVALLALLGIGTQAQEQKQPPVKDQHIQVKVDALLRQMTLMEKIGQLNQIPGIQFPGAPKPEDPIAQGLVSSVLWVSDPPVAAHRSGKVATAYPIADWIGCRAGIPHDLS
jgi:hypothetical protein